MYFLSFLHDPRPTFISPPGLILFLYYIYIQWSFCSQRRLGGKIKEPHWSVYVGQENRLNLNLFPQRPSLNWLTYVPNLRNYLSLETVIDLSLLNLSSKGFSSSQLLFSFTNLNYKVLKSRLHHKPMNFTFSFKKWNVICIIIN